MLLKQGTLSPRERGRGEGLERSILATQSSKHQALGPYPISLSRRERDLCRYLCPSGEGLNSTPLSPKTGYGSGIAARPVCTQEVSASGSLRAVPNENPRSDPSSRSDSRPNRCLVCEGFGVRQGRCWTLRCVEHHPAPRGRIPVEPLRRPSGQDQALSGGLFAEAAADRHPATTTAGRSEDALGRGGVEVRAVIGVDDDGIHLRRLGRVCSLQSPVQRQGNRTNYREVART